MERANAWKDADKTKIFDFAEQYRKFISDCKTERECVIEAVKLAKDHGYRNLDDIVKNKEELKAGDKVYAVIMKKSIILINVGEESLENGLNILGAHIDSPRIDVKQNPLYEDSDLVLLDTHYYGGLKKYQWVARELSIHGVVAMKDGSIIDINIGDRPGDPVFCVTDLLPHLADQQMKKTGEKVVEGEDLNLLIGSMPAETEDKSEKELVKKNILSILKERYGFEEEDFLSAELEIVPAGEAKNCGFDSSMIMGYGHDDRVCSYPSLIALLESDDLKKTGVCILVDKEEIGSVGATGMTSNFFENTIAELIDRLGTYSELSLRRCLANSKMLSSDVSAALDPNYPSFFEAKNAAYLGRGVVFNKFTGARGKSGSNDASAEFIGELRSIMDSNDVKFQTAELGKVDVGGGGTIAYILARYGMNVIDSGVAVLNMHAPAEIISKVDLYEALKCYKAFLANA
ncbi:MAG: aminopeptidase [Clostridiales bacterium]|nr:aminopeptidase [Clostridiales bacterium]MDU1042524.1 aminopeptidase [Clostridiales bacterium]MDU3490708.1 aminopeptidase [Clostridiales bacterium]